MCAITLLLVVKPETTQVSMNWYIGKKKKKKYSDKKRTNTNKCNFDDLKNRSLHNRSQI